MRTMIMIMNRWKEINLPISKDKKERETIKLKIRKVFEKRWEAQDLPVRKMHSKKK